MNKFFGYLSCAIIIHNVDSHKKYWLAHGGIPQKRQDIFYSNADPIEPDIPFNKKFYNESYIESDKEDTSGYYLVNDETAISIRWGDFPYEGSCSGRGTGVQCNKEEYFIKFMKKFGIDGIIRGHQDSISNSLVFRKEQLKSSMVVFNKLKNKEKLDNIYWNDQVASGNTTRYRGPLARLHINKEDNPHNGDYIQPVVTLSTNTDKGRKLTADSFGLLRFDITQANVDKFDKNILTSKNTIKDIDKVRVEVLAIIKTVLNPSDNKLIASSKDQPKNNGLISPPFIFKPDTMIGEQKGGKIDENIEVLANGVAYDKYLTTTDIMKWTTSSNNIYSDHAPIKYEYSIGTKSIQFITWNIAYQMEITSKGFYSSKFFCSISNSDPTVKSCDETTEIYKKRLTNILNAVDTMIKESNVEYVLLQECCTRGINSPLVIKNIAKNIKDFDEKYDVLNFSSLQKTKDTKGGEKNTNQHNQFCLIVKKQTPTSLSKIKFFDFKKGIEEEKYPDEMSEYVANKISSYKPENTNFKADIDSVMCYVIPSTETIFFNVHFKFGELIWQRQKEIYDFMNAIVHIIRSIPRENTLLHMYQNYDIVFSGDFNLNILQRFPQGIKNDKGTPMEPNFFKCENVPNQKTIISTTRDNLPSAFGDNSNKYNTTNIDFSVFYPALVPDASSAVASSAAAAARKSVVASSVVASSVVASSPASSTARKSVVASSAASSAATKFVASSAATNKVMEDFKQKIPHDNTNEKSSIYLEKINSRLKEITDKIKEALLENSKDSMLNQEFEQFKLISTELENLIKKNKLNYKLIIESYEYILYKIKDLTPDKAIEEIKNFEVQILPILETHKKQKTSIETLNSSLESKRKKLIQNIILATTAAAAAAAAASSTASSAASSAAALSAAASSAAALSAADEAAEEAFKFAKVTQKKYNELEKELSTTSFNTYLKDITSLDDKSVELTNSLDQKIRDYIMSKSKTRKQKSDAKLDANRVYDEFLLSNKNINEKKLEVDTIFSKINTLL